MAYRVTGSAADRLVLGPLRPSPSQVIGNLFLPWPFRGIVMEEEMHGIIYLVGLVVVVMFLLSLLGLR